MDENVNKTNEEKTQNCTYTKDNFETKKAKVVDSY